MTAPRTTFSGGISPFTGKRTHGARIVDDTPPADTPKAGESKYTELFEALQVGQAIACEPEETQRYSSAMRHWLMSRGLWDTLRVLKVKNYKHAKPGTPAGRVWLVEKTSQD